MPGLISLRATRRLDRFGLLGHVDGAHAAAADFFEQFVAVDNRVRRDVEQFVSSCERCTIAMRLLLRLWVELHYGLSDHVAAFNLSCREQLLDLLAQCVIAYTRPVEIGRSFLAVYDVECGKVDRLGRVLV